MVFRVEQGVPRPSDWAVGVIQVCDALDEGRQVLSDAGTGSRLECDQAGAPNASVPMKVGGSPPNVASGAIKVPSERLLGFR